MQTTSEETLVCPHCANQHGAAKRYGYSLRFVADSALLRHLESQGLDYGRGGLRAIVSWYRPQKRLASDRDEAAPVRTVGHGRAKRRKNDLDCTPGEDRRGGGPCMGESEKRRQYGDTSQ